MTDPQLWISALEIGSFYALIALGYLFTVIGAGFFNFALGPLAMVAGLGAAWLTLQVGVNVYLSALIGLVVVIGLSALIEVGVVRPVQARSGTGELPALVAVAAVLFALQQLAGLAFGRVHLPGPRLLDVPPLSVGTAFLQPSTLLLLIAAAVVFIGAGLFVRYTALGRQLRAVGDNVDAARVLGVPVVKVRIVAFMVSGLVVGLAGLFFSAKAGVGFDSGLGWALSGFLALVIGGTGRIWAPLVGGLVLGSVQVFTPYYLPAVGPDVLILILALLFFAFRPQGFFVRKVRA